MNESGDYYATVNLCSNIFTNVRKIILIDGKEPFVFRIGVVPMVTLQRVIKPTEWIQVVKDNRSSISNLVVRENIVASELQVFFLGMTVLRAISKNKELIISSINLKVLGFDVVGNESGMRVGGIQFAENSFENIDVGIEIASRGNDIAHHALK